MTVLAGYLTHCRTHEWLTEQPLSRQAATDLAGTHDDTAHDGEPTATVLPLIGGALPLPISHTGALLTA